MPRVNPGPPCQVCGISSVARRLCAKHLKRWQRHGNIEQTRPVDWGAREKHPLYSCWTQTLRSPHGREERWNDFRVFLSDVGDKPSKQHVLRRHRLDAPCGPENFYWLETFKSEDAARAARQWRKQNPLRAKEHDLRKKGLTLEKYDAMLEAQGGRCAICQRPESVVRINGAVFGLAVDHNHKTRKIRGLLCARCNRGLGLLGDSVEQLSAAIAYLRHHHNDF